MLYGSVAGSTKPVVLYGSVAGWGFLPCFTILWHRGGNPTVLYGRVAGRTVRCVLYGSVASAGSRRALRQGGVVVERLDRAVLYGGVALWSSVLTSPCFTAAWPQPPPPPI